MTITPKSYGYSLIPAFLPEGIAKFFCASSASLDAPSQQRCQGLPPTLLIRILKGIIAEAKKIRDVFATVDIRMRSGSLLVAYEADWEMAREVLDAQEQREREEQQQPSSSENSARSSISDGKKPASTPPGKGTAMRTNGNGLDADQPSDDEAVTFESDEEEYDEDDEEYEDSEDEEDAPPEPYIIKLIDFAHTRYTPGQGPDEGVLLGLDTTISLLEGRIRELQAQETPQAERP